MKQIQPGDLMLGNLVNITEEVVVKDYGENNIGEITAIVNTGINVTCIDPRIEQNLQWYIPNSKDGMQIQPIKITPEILDKLTNVKRVDDKMYIVGGVLDKKETRLWAMGWNKYQKMWLIKDWNEYIVARVEYVHELQNIVNISTSGEVKITMKQEESNAQIIKSSIDAIKKMVAKIQPEEIVDWDSYKKWIDMVEKIHEMSIKTLGKLKDNQNK